MDYTKKCFERTVLLANKKEDSKKMGRFRAATMDKIAKKIYEEREDNIIKRDVIKTILKMYMEECRKALLRGERIELPGIGTIIPEVKTHRSCFLPTCNNANHENAPYTRMKIRRLDSLQKEMNKTLLDNIENGVYGLEELPFDLLQINNLKANGYIPADEEISNN